MLQMFVHGSEEFGAVKEKGFVVAPGMETQIAVTATHTYSAPVLEIFSPKNRECYFPNELPLRYHSHYSRSSCIIECETEFIYRECNCVPYFSPGTKTTNF